MKLKGNHIISKAGNAKFSVSKWFMDCVTEEGTCVIAYAAEMIKNGVVIPYKSLLVSEPGMVPMIKTKFKACEWPMVEGKMIKWADKSFGIQGRWKQEGVGLKSRLLDSEDGILDWYCYQSSSSVKICLDSGDELKGNGYVEHLFLTIQPWKLNIEKLRWGRFICKDINIVWIGFTGPNARRWVWCNGKEVIASRLDDDIIIIPDLDLKLKLESNRILEKGPKMLNVIKGIVGFITEFNKYVPDFFLKATETKWLSKGMLYKKKEVIHEGWVIHELVEFC